MNTAIFQSKLMRYAFWSVLIAAVFFIGCYVGSTPTYQNLYPSANHSALSLPPTAQSAHGRSETATITQAQLQQIDWSKENMVLGVDVIKAMADNEGMLDYLLRTLDLQTNDTARFNILQAFGLSRSPRLLQQAVEWTNQQDAQKRINGYRLLGMQEVQESLIKPTLLTLTTEKNPKVVLAAINALQAPQLLSPAQSEAVAPVLHGLTSHADPDVRASSIQQLARWDKARKYLESDILSMFNDKAQLPQLAAVGATAIASLTSNEVKSGLLRLIAGKDTDAEVRQVAVMQMVRFSLTMQEYLLCQQTNK